MKCHYQNVKTMAKVYKPYSSFFVSLYLISLSCSFLHLSISSLASSTSLHTLLAIFTDSKISLHCHTQLVNCILLFSQSILDTYEMFTKLEWLVNHILSFSQSIYTTYVQNFHRLSPSAGLAQACPKLVV